MGVTIRTARLADRERIVAISSQIWEGDDYVPHVIDEWLRMRDSEVAVADLNGSVIAFARAVNLAPGYVWLEGIRTDTASQGHGAGKALTEYFIEKATREGTQRIGLSTYVDNLASIHIIEQYHFQRVASFILAEAKLNTPARAFAELSPEVSTVPFDEARAWILGSASIGPRAPASSRRGGSSGRSRAPTSSPGPPSTRPSAFAAAMDHCEPCSSSASQTTDPRKPRSISPMGAPRTWTCSSVMRLPSIREPSTSRR